jgi:hypothetical protein
MKSFLHVLGILATVGVLVADTLLLGVPAFRNGWWTLSFFAFPAALLALAWGGEGKKGLRVAAWLVFLAGLGGWIGLRNVGKIPGTASVAVGERAPDFMLKDQDGKDLRLSDLTDKGRVVLVFFRGRY